MQSSLNVTAFEVASEICHMPTNQLAFLKYLQFRDLLKGWRFVLVSDRGPQAGFAVNRTFGAGAIVKSPFVGEHVVVIDDRVATATLASQSVVFPMDFSISLDTQAVSCIEPYLGRRTSRLPKDFEEVFYFLSKKETNCDPMPYMLENLSNIKNPNNYEAIYQKARGYETLRTIDLDLLRTTGQAMSKLSDHDLNKKAQETVASMLQMARNTQFYDMLERNQTIFLVILLKCVCIQFDRSKRTPQQKIRQLMHFMDQTLQSMFLAEAALGVRYFTKGQNIKFFGKIQSGRDDLLRTLNGMAWDLYHFRQVTHMLSGALTQEIHYYFPAMLTFDKGFAEILDVYSLRACGIGPVAQDFVTAPAFDFFEEICVGMDEVDRIEVRSLFSPTAVRLTQEM